MELPRPDPLVSLRRELHAHPEPSGREIGTAACLREFLLPCNPSRVFDNLGGHGLAVVFSAPDGAAGPTVALRAELDALPIRERGERPHASRDPAVAHACGHDGHMAALCGVAANRRERPLVRGRLVLLFQPAEETGQGARAVIADSRWRDLEVDYVYAVHNLPGYALGEVLLREGVVTVGSIGLIIRLEGRTAHAAHPEQGISPAATLSRLVPALAGLPTALSTAAPLAMVTVVHARLGDLAFGTLPGSAEIMCTLRADDEGLLAELRRLADALVGREAQADGLHHRLSWVEEFPVTENDAEALAVAARAAAAAGLAAGEPVESPFRWSEDLGWFLREASGALVGIGSGHDQPVLHAPDFDYPDALLPPTVRLQEAILGEHGLLAD
jgi:amidohydrolase